MQKRARLLRRAAAGSFGGLSSPRPLPKMTNQKKTDYIFAYLKSPRDRLRTHSMKHYRRSAYDLVSSPHSNQTPASRNQFLDEVVKLQAKLYSCAGPDICTTPWNRRFQILKLPERRSKLAAGSLAWHHFIGFFFTFGFGSAGIVTLTRLARYSLSSTSLM